MALSNRQLYKKHDELKSLKIETYDKLKNRCVNLIAQSANMGEFMCIFEIPNYLFGSSFPMVDVATCAKYIMNKIIAENNNIKPTFCEPNFIIFDWRK